MEFDWKIGIKFKWLNRETWNVGYTYTGKFWYNQLKSSWLNPVDKMYLDSIYETNNSDFIVISGRDSNGIISYFPQFECYPMELKLTSEEKDIIDNLIESL